MVFFWIKGKAGSGKSTIMKFVFQQTLTSKDGRDVNISFFFNARGEELEKTTPGMYRSLLFQLLEFVPELQVLLDELRSFKYPESYENHSWNIEILQHIHLWLWKYFEPALSLPI
ncbi:uncharacterized protein BDW43DRAFT_316146 [Aspergillus alliaceus]|uniref:uncharacterized protein n=1 Tax=Petromyces alliaceus TaxID=209559 RepID=UPI0012A51225|nr:uncharacterized protein BDW43DRAFT_316146 [Aspergillus alliaceus]KAB8228167.1 hypothetical protein BDW43DRAFT_316146 [Aspergillus alliaceus]